MKKSIISFFLAGLSISRLIMPMTANAQKAHLNIGITPPLTHVVIQPGKTALTTVTLENQGLYDVNLTPNFVDFSSDNKTGIPVLSENMTFPFISLQDAGVTLNSPFVLKTSETKQLVFELALPENSLEKEYHFSLVFNVEPIQSTLNDSSQTTISGQLVSNFIVTVSLSAKDQGVIQLQGFEAPLFVDSLSPIVARVYMQNSGKNTTVTQGEFKITNMLGNIVYQSELLPENILPGSIRQVFGSQVIIKETQEYKIQQPFRYQGLFLIGLYTLTLTYHAPGQEIQTFEHKLFAVPISVLIFIVVVYIVYLMYSRTRMFRGRTHKDKPEE